MNKQTADRLSLLYDMQMELHREQNWQHYPDKEKIAKLKAEINALMQDKEIIAAARELDSKLKPPAED